MNKPDEPFDQKLTQHYKERKERITLTSDQQKALLNTATHTKPKKPTRFSFTLQLTSLACALGVFAFIVFDNNNVINTEPKTVLNSVFNTIDIHDYSIIKTHEINQAGSYASTFTEQKHALDSQLANDLRRHQQRHIEYGTLVKVDNDWYIASCNDEVLVQIKHSLLSDLKGKHAVESNINTGDMLAMAHNGKGQIIALKHAGAGVKMCRG
ncbi:MULTISPECIES: hypothetical protein [unclassified Pseudoalteromonas]|uniref:hypothetical protein n=1 Tax=unclassified Pseudoalteromonas TaxID=194690 RepID=UPI0015FA56D8|nr:MULTISPECIES: hypothetical protein [unclassified Pseudoalteromonas]MBB1305358.1 hypothetical protein [Pseudoalteromonas sp. SR43-5]MBB1451281.1 hypothetical protein [Pseudoalteromonas sp. SG43-1]